MSQNANKKFDTSFDQLDDYLNNLNPDNFLNDFI